MNVDKTVYRCEYTLDRKGRYISSPHDEHVMLTNLNEIFGYLNQQNINCKGMSPKGKCKQDGI